MYVISISFVTDEDSELILGRFMVEIMSPSSDSKDPDPPPPLPPRFDGESNNKRCRKISGSDSPSLIPDKREPDGVCRFLKFITKKSCKK